MSIKYPKRFKCVVCEKQFLKVSVRAKLCSKECFAKHTNTYQKVRRKSSIEHSLLSVLYGCKNRAKRTGLDYNLSVNFILDLLKKQEHKCAVSSLLLKPSTANTKVYSDPQTISIDRIDPNIGYVEGNVRLVTYMYNSCKGQWTDEQVKQMCVGVLNDRFG